MGLQDGGSNAHEGELYTRWRPQQQQQQRLMLCCVRAGFMLQAQCGVFA
jgi:hypothetical protein